MKTTFYFVVIVLWILSASCNRGNVDQMVQKSTYFRSTAAPEWARDANIYQVNIQYYTTEGTFNAFSKYLPLLKEMGVKIIWITTNGTDYNSPVNAVFLNGNIANPGLGTLNDFRGLVQKIHDLNMKVIIDWMPNQNSFTALPSNQVNYSANITNNQIALTKNITSNLSAEAMFEDMLFGLQKTNIDGYHCTQASEVSDDFWLNAIPRLRQVKPDIFMLAQSEYSPYLNLELFTATYSNSFDQLLNEIVNGKKNALGMDRWYKEDRATYIAGYHMHRVATQYENFTSAKCNCAEAASEAVAVLAGTFEGIPLMDAGKNPNQNLYLISADKEKKNQKDYMQHEFYKKLLYLKKHNRALWNGIDGGNPRIIVNDNPNIFAFIREKYGDKALIVINLSDQLQVATLEDDAMPGTYTNLFDESATSLPSRMNVELKPWGYMVLTNRSVGF